MDVPFLMTSVTGMISNLHKDTVANGQNAISSTNPINIHRQSMEPLSIGHDVMLTQLMRKELFYGNNKVIKRKLIKEYCFTAYLYN